MSIETTIQSLYFHDNTSIYSVCSTNTHIYTAGGDSKIRSWHIDIKEQTKSETSHVFKITTPINTTMKVTYCDTLEGHLKTVNCVRFFEINSISYLLSCDDGGKICLWIIKGCKYEFYQIYSTEPCQEILYATINNKSYVLCGLTTGNLLFLNLILNPKPKVKLLQTKKTHGLSIDGLAFNSKYNIISSLSKDATCKLFQIKNEKLFLFETIKKIDEKHNFADENKVILTRRHSFSYCGNFLYLTSCEEEGKNIFVVLRYPFHEHCVYQTIRNLNEPVLKIIENQDLGVVFFTNYNCYIPKREIIIKDCVLQPIIDACFHEKLIIIASVDGFLTTIRFNN
ncbi:Chromatin assembly factor 1 subunit p60 [Cucumispora dikerogammari]|nr:Chromatin assembly factor 1 subunit p60 [Cucumispora dikerogammari]